MTKLIRVGIVGLGGQVQKNHLPALLASKNCSISAVCDSNASLAQRLGAELGIPSFTDLQTMASSKLVDAVLISVPHSFHFELTRVALENNLHVLKEKPFAISTEEAVFLAGFAKTRGLVLMTCVQRRFADSNISFKRNLTLIGEPYLMNARYSMDIQYLSEGWRGSDALAGGGCLIDMGYHMIDQILWYFGKPRSISASFSNGARPLQKYEVEDSASLLVDWGKLHGTVQISRAMPPKTDYIEVFGTNGSLSLSKGILTLRDSSGDSILETVSTQLKIDPYLRQLDFFAYCIGYHVSPPSHVPQVSLIDRCYSQPLLQMEK